MPDGDVSIGRGVVVLGTHRSGTSAITGAIDALGLPACRADDRFPIRQWNARGNFESASVSMFDEHLLALLGGRWFAPPHLDRRWASSEKLDSWRVLAAQLFAAAHPTPTWVWKDPRACVLMPFWDLVLGADTPRVVVLRDPMESAASLAARDGMPVEHGLALVERNLRSAFRDSAGRPVFVTAYEEALQAPHEWGRLAGAFIRAQSLPLQEPLRLGAVAGALTDELRHQRAPESRPLPPGLQRLWAWAWDRRGPHPSLSIAGLPRESQTTGPTLLAAL